MSVKGVHSAIMWVCTYGRGHLNAYLMTRSTQH